MIHRLCLVLALALGRSLAAQQAPGTTGAAPTSAADCLRQAADLRTRRLAGIRQSGGAVDADQARRVGAEVKAFGRTCADHLDLANPSVGDYPALTQLYVLIGDTTKAIDWVERGLMSLRATPRQRGEILLSGIRVAMAGVGAVPDTLKLSEAYMKQLDALPDSLAGLKMAGHGTLLAHYDYADMDALVLHHALAIVDIAKKTRDTSMFAVTAYTSVARALADYGHPDSALAVLDTAESHLVAMVPRERIEQAFADSRKLYRLVGQPASPIHGDYWLNAATEQREVRFDDGRVRLLQFGAHWCIPCRNSYPSIERINARFAGAAFETVFETELYGQFNGSAADARTELADDQMYYVDQHRFRFLIAIMRASPTQRNDNEERYAVLGIPQTMVVDKHGLIRTIVSGWDVGNEARLTKLIESLLAETSPPPAR